MGKIGRRGIEIISGFEYTDSGIRGKNGEPLRYSDLYKKGKRHIGGSSARECAEEVWMKKMRKKKIWIGAAVVFAAVAVVLAGIKLYRIYLRDQSGILLAFDDYSESSWEDHFDLFDEYDANVTFFINGQEPTDFCYRAIERGHEIGFHTVGHESLTECTQDQIYQEAIAPIEVFREKGIELTSFAYPYGNYNMDLNEQLLDYYKVVRGAWFCELYTKYDLKEGFVEAMPLDNTYFETQEQFEQRVTEVLSAVKDTKGIVVCMYSHAIGGGGWCISEEKLEFLLKKAQELGLKFYTFKDLQEN